MRNQLVEMYLDYLNNFLTVERFAEYHGLSMVHGLTLVNLAREVFQSNHPEA